MKLPKKMIVIQNTESRRGEFDFCCKTQEHYVLTLEDAEEEINSAPIDDEMEYIIYEISVKRIKSIRVSPEGE